MDNNNELLIKQSNEILNLFEKMYRSSAQGTVEKVEDVGYPPDGELQQKDMCFFQIKELSYDEDYPHREAFENVLQSVDNTAFNFVYILSGTQKGIELCIGIVKNRNEDAFNLKNQLSAADYGNIVKSTFEGNFNGSELEKLSGDKLTRFVTGTTQLYKSAGLIVGIPSENEKAGSDDYDYQGIDTVYSFPDGLSWRNTRSSRPLFRHWDCPV